MQYEGRYRYIQGKPSDARECWAEVEAGAMQEVHFRDERDWGTISGGLADGESKRGFYRYPGLTEHPRGQFELTRLDIDGRVFLFGRWHDVNVTQPGLGIEGEWLFQLAPAAKGS